MCTLFTVMHSPIRPPPEIEINYESEQKMGEGGAPLIYACFEKNDLSLLARAHFFLQICIFHRYFQKESQVFDMASPWILPYACWKSIKWKVTGFHCAMIFSKIVLETNIASIHDCCGLNLFCSSFSAVSTTNLILFSTTTHTSLHGNDRRAFPLWVEHTLRFLSWWQRYCCFHLPPWFRLVRLYYTLNATLPLAFGRYISKFLDVICRSQELCCF